MVYEKGGITAGTFYLQDKYIEFTSTDKVFSETLFGVKDSIPLYWYKEIGLNQDSTYAMTFTGKPGKTGVLYEVVGIYSDTLIYCDIHTSEPMSYHLVRSSITPLKL